MALDLIEEACRLETQLLDPKVRLQPSLVAELLHKDFIEYGSSGRRWTRDDIIVALSSEIDAEQIATFDLTGSHLSADIVHVTYRSDHRGHRAWRSSIWKREDGRCQMLFHQGTPIPPTDTN